MLNGSITICDFGFNNSLLNTRLAHPNRFLSPEWLAPEILSHGVVEDVYACDVYSFGLVFYMIVTRQQLFQIENPMLLGYLIAKTFITPEIPSYVPPTLVYPF